MASSPSGSRNLQLTLALLLSYSFIKNNIPEDLVMLSKKPAGIGEYWDRAFGLYSAGPAMSLGLGSFQLFTSFTFKAWSATATRVLDP